MYSRRFKICHRSISHCVNGPDCFLLLFKILRVRRFELINERSCGVKNASGKVCLCLAVKNISRGLCGIDFGQDAVGFDRYWPLLMSPPSPLSNLICLVHLPDSRKYIWVRMSFISSPSIVIKDLTSELQSLFSPGSIPIHNPLVHFQHRLYRLQRQLL